MSVINQVLKDLDRQGANTSAPTGVIAVNQHDATTPRWPLLLGLLVLAAAAWWFWPASSSPVLVSPRPMPASVEVAPQLRLSQQLSPLSEPALASTSQVKPVPELKPAPVDSAVGPAAISPVIPPRLDTRLPEPAKHSQNEHAEVVSAMTGEARKALTTQQSQVVKEMKPLTPQVQAEDAWRQASRLLEQGRNHDAQDKLESVLHLDPAHVGARQSLVALVLEAGDSPRAEVLLREGQALSVNDPWYARSLAQLHLQRGETAQAAAILKTGLAKRADATNWSLYASTLAKLGKRGDAAQAYREALRLDPTQGNWWIGLAVALEQGEEKAEAAAAYQRALQTRLSGELREFAQQKSRELGAR
jgi:MSHA biogenesis protein MshN